MPGSAGELLPVLAPTTKALAQALAGNTRLSGQLVHARNVLGQAERLVEDRQVDRLPPAQREEFFEQLARLKLTLADADEAGLTGGAEVDVEPVPIRDVGAERLREVALRLATSEPTAHFRPRPDQPEPEAEEPVTAEPRAPAMPERSSDEPPRVRPGSTHRERLRLKPARPAPDPAET